MWFQSPHDQKWHFVGTGTDRCFTCSVKRPASPGQGENAPPPHTACTVCLTATTKPSVQPQKGHVPSRPITEADMFICAVKSLSSLGQQCRNILEEKRCGKRPTISGVVKQAHSTVEQWQRVCTKSLAAHPPGDVFWKPVIVKCAGTDTFYTLDDLSAHIDASLAMFRRYTTEEQSERAEAATQLLVEAEARPLAEAAQRLSTLLTATIGVTFQQAFQQLPTQMKEAIAQSVKRKEWSEKYSGPICQDKFSPCLRWSAYRSFSL